MSDLAAYSILTYLLVLCLAGVFAKRRLGPETLHDPISAAIAAIATSLPEAAAAVAPEAIAGGLGAVGDVAALTLPEVAVTAAAPAAIGLGDIAASVAPLALGGALDAVGGFGGGFGGGAAAAPGDAITISAPSDFAPGVQAAGGAPGAPGAPGGLTSFSWGDLNSAQFYGPSFTSDAVSNGVITQGPLAGAAVDPSTGLVGAAAGQPGAITVGGVTLPPMSAPDLAAYLQSNAAPATPVGGGGAQIDVVPGFQGAPQVAQAAPTTIEPAPAEGGAVTPPAAPQPAAPQPTITPQAAPPETIEPPPAPAPAAPAPPNYAALYGQDFANALQGSLGPQAQLYAQGAIASGTAQPGMTATQLIDATLSPEQAAALAGAQGPAGAAQGLITQAVEAGQGAGLTPGQIMTAGEPALPTPVAPQQDFLTRLFNQLNPIGSANAQTFTLPGGQTLTVQPGGGTLVTNPQEALGSSSRLPGDVSPTLAGGGSQATPSSSLTGGAASNLMPGGQLTSIGAAPPAPGGAPPELAASDVTASGVTPPTGGTPASTVTDTSTSVAGSTAGTAAAPPPSAPSSVTGAVDTSATGTPSGATTTPTTGATTAPIGSDQVGGTAPLTSSTPLSSAQQAAAGVGTTDSLFGDIKNWAKENSGLITLGGALLSPLMSFLNKPKIPLAGTSSATTQAGAAGLAPAQNVALPASQAAAQNAVSNQAAPAAALGNAIAAQAAPAAAFQGAQIPATTAATVGVPAALAGLNTTAAAATPLIKQQSDLSGGLAASAQPLLSASTTGVLPLGETSAIEEALGSSRAAIRGGYENLGLTGSSTEAQDIAASSGNILSQVPSILNNLVTQGIQEATASGGAASGALGGVDRILNAIQGIQSAIGTETSAAGGVTGAAGGVTGGAGAVTGAANAVTGGTNAVTSAANDITNAVNAITSAGSTAANTDINVARLQLEMDQQLQQALTQLGRSLALSTISPSTVNITG